VLQASAGPDVSSKVTAETKQNLQIHDGFAQQQREDEEKEKEVRSNKDLSALQLMAKTVPGSDVAAKVAAETKANIPIHDGFAQQQKDDEDQERQIRANKDLSALQVMAETVPGSDVASKAAAETKENIQIHDGFEQQQREDEEKEKDIRANKDLSALQLVAKTLPGSDVAAKVAAETKANIQIHDGFAQQQKEDEEKEREVKANKDLSALQLRYQTAPTSVITSEVAKESMENLQIHDGFAQQEKADEEKETSVKADKDFSALQLRSKTLPGSDVANRVAIESRENLQIHDGFAQQQAADEEKEREIKARKELSALQLRVHTAPASDVASEVAAETSQNLQIHDGFLEQQKKDETKERAVKANKDLQALQLRSIRASQ
jgi:hypothetical protein